jgi:putative ABC transport system permease protein
VAEIALSLVLLVGAGLMARTFLHLASIDPGLRPEGVITADISLPRGRYGDPEAIAGFYRTLLDRLPTLPSVQGAAAISALPMSGTDESTSLYVEGQAVASTSEMPQAHERTISPDYFKTMGVPVRSGRSFGAADGPQGARVAMVNETMARKLWPGRDPIGRRVALDYEAMHFAPGKPPELDLEGGWREVVGVVGDVRHNGPQEEPRPELYVPYLQAPDRDMTIVVRTAADPAGLAETIRREVMAIDRGQPLTRVRTMQALVARVMAKPRFSLILLGVFAGTAVLLALVGIYGVIAYSVGQRRREIGIRVALGARSGQVIAMVLRQWLRLVLAGVVLGLAAALALTRLMASLLYGVRPTDPPTFAAVAGVLVAMSLLASWVPARRATRVDPMIALRSE